MCSAIWWWLSPTQNMETVRGTEILFSIKNKNKYKSCSFVIICCSRQIYWFYLLLLFFFLIEIEKSNSIENMRKKKRALQYRASNEKTLNSRAVWPAPCDEKQAYRYNIGSYSFSMINLAEKQPPTIFDFSSSVTLVFFFLAYVFPLESACFSRKFMISTMRVACKTNLWQTAKNPPVNNEKAFCCSHTLLHVCES